MNHGDNFYLQSSRLGLVNEVGVPPKGEEGTLGIQIFHQDQTQGPTAVKRPGMGLSAQIKILRIPDTASGSSTDPGSGLGLAITKAIIEQHNGSIRVSSGDEGTRVEVRF